NFVIATDVVNEGHHFLDHWPCGVVDIGYSSRWKLVARNISDMNTMGAITTVINISLAVSENTPDHWVGNFGGGIANACYWLGAQQIVSSGGDLTRADSIATAITTTGDLLGEPVLRKAASHVDGFLLIHTGNVGTAAAGFVV